MADVYEQNLASKSTLTTTDYIRVVGSDNVSYKQLVSDVAKKIIENYTGSTLAGSAQSVKSAVDSLNSKIDGTVTAAGGSNVTNLSVAQYGKMVVINGYVSNVDLTANTETHIATISGVPIPASAVRTLCGVAPAAYSHPADVAYITISTTGKILVTSIVTGTRVVYFSVSYVV